MTYSLNSGLDIDVLSKKFTAKGRLQISDFFDLSVAEDIETTLKSLDWQLVLNTKDKHVDIHKFQLDDMGAKRAAEIQAFATSRGAHEFAYLYENHPIADMLASGNLKDKNLIRLYETMNSKKVVEFFNAFTKTGINFCDMQATNYGPGHFLTRHDDGNVGKNRKFAYVYSLCRDWQAEWGGQLQFLDEDGTVTQSFIPKYNTLSMFEVPQSHHVSPVSSFTPNPRLSITGWYRTGEPML